MAVLITLGLLVPAGATAAPAKPGVTDRAGRQRRPEHRHAHGAREPERGGDDVHVRVRHHARLRDAGPEPAARAPARATAASRSPPTSAGLAPATTYHYRLVARNAQGRHARRGPHVPHPAPAAGPHARRDAEPGLAGRAHADRGTLSGTGNAERQIVLQSNPFPYTQGFQNASDVHLTNGDGTLLVPDPVGAAEHAVPRGAAEPAAGREPDRLGRRRAEGEPVDQARATRPRAARSSASAARSRPRTTARRSPSSA